TPVLLFTGSAGNVTPDKARKDHEDLIRTIGALNAGALMPEEGLLSKLLKRSKELSAASTEKVLEATEEARQKARPYTDKARETAEQAKEAAARASDAAKPYLDKSKEAARKAYDDAMKLAKELMQKKPESPPKND